MYHASNPKNPQTLDLDPRVRAALQAMCRATLNSPRGTSFRAALRRLAELESPEALALVDALLCGTGTPVSVQRDGGCVSAQHAVQHRVAPVVSVAHTRRAVRI